MKPVVALTMAMVFLPSPVRAQGAGDLLPTPAVYQATAGTLAIESRARIEGVAAPAVAQALLAYFATSGRGVPLRLERAAGMAPEAYRLSVTPQGAVVTASGDAGLFYGGITLWQMVTAAKGRQLAAATVEDQPAFAWRGALLDSARHFQSAAFVRSFIDWMAAHKLNRLHWHLVDDQAWRMEIKAFPKLTQVGAWRRPATAPGAPPLPPVGGFYSQAELRAIVAYAAARGVTIVPEIEMPGHALAAIRAYPEWGMGASVPPGIESDWGVFPFLYNTEDGTLTALEKILDEVMAVFPSPEIHIGGDEAVKDQWTASAATQARMRSLSLKNETELQAWFMDRIASYLSKHGRRAIGWDELLDGKLPADAAITSWRGSEGAAKAAGLGHDAILSPAPELYLDHFQARDAAEPPGRADTIALASVLAFDPGRDRLPESQRRHLLGVQGNLWSEHIRTEGRMAWMAFPRLSALAEVGWTGKPSKDIGGFMARLKPQLARLRPLGLTAADSAWRPAIAAHPAGPGKATVTVSNQVGSHIALKLGGRASPYTGPVTVALPATIEASANGATAKSRFTAANLRDRDSSALATCTDGATLALEDDYPARGPRARFTVNILKPCWIYRGAALAGMRSLSLDVGQLPFNFQIGKDREGIVFRKPATPAGEFEVRLDGCEGRLIATLPLAPAISSPGVTRLTAPLPALGDGHDLCITYTATSPDPLWAVQTIGLHP